MKIRQAKPAFPLKVLLVDDHSIIIEGVRSLLSQQAPFPISLSYCSPKLRDILDSHRSNQFDIAIFNIVDDKHHHLQLLTELRHLHSELKLAIYCSYNQLETRLSKLSIEAILDPFSDVDEFLEALSSIRRGRRFISSSFSSKKKERNGGKKASNAFLTKNHITPREIEVLKLIGKAHNTKEIAKVLFISDQTVSVHRKNIMRKLGVKNTASLVRLAVEQQLI